MNLIDKNRNGIIEKDEWFEFIKGGGTLPDFNTGPGHHGDFEVCFPLSD